MSWCSVGHWFLSADWAVKCFQRGYGCTTCLEDVRTSAHQSCMCLMKGWGENPTESKRPLAATVSSCNVSKPQLHEKVSSKDLAIAGDVPLPAFFCALSCLLHVKNEHGNILRKWQRHPTVTKSSLLESQSITFPNVYFNVFLCKWTRDLCSKLTHRLYLCFPVHSNFKFPCLTCFQYKR